MNRPWMRLVQTCAINTTLALASCHWRIKHNYRVKCFFRRNHSGMSQTRRYCCMCRRWRDLFFSPRNLDSPIVLLQRKFLDGRYTHLPLRDPVVIATSVADDGTCRCIFHRNDPVENRYFYRHRRGLSQIFDWKIEVHRRLDLRTAAPYPGSSWEKVNILFSCTLIIHPEDWNLWNISASCAKRFLW